MNDRAKIVAYYLQKLDDPDFQITQVRADLERNNFDEEEISVIVRLVDSELQRRVLTSARSRHAIEWVWVGGVLTVLGAGFTIATYVGIIDMGDSFMLVYGPFLGGLAIMGAGLARKGKGNGGLSIKRRNGRR
ncbi:MAG TPA: hypothetical protein VF191_04200 [Cyclobacteriaceae bacterium]